VPEFFAQTKQIMNIPAPLIVTEWNHGVLSSFPYQDRHFHRPRISLEIRACLNQQSLTTLSTTWEAENFGWQ